MKLNQDYWTEQQRLADDYIADREAKLFDYFKDYEAAMRDPEQLMHDPDEMKKRSVELNISAKEWAAHYNRQKAKAAGAF